jgi:isocitrate dehydrogenase kinase/phosphatase
MLLQKLDSPLAGDIARAMMDGFNRHYRCFAPNRRAPSTASRHRTGTASSAASASASSFTTCACANARKRLEREFKAAEQPMEVWQQVKLLYIGMLVDHRQPELAETFFNSVTTKILHRSYFQNDFIFVRPAISTEYIENEDPAKSATYRAYYPRRDTMLDEIRRMVRDFGLRVDFEDFERDTLSVHEALMGLFDHGHLRANFQIQVLSSLFYRNKGAYVVGKVINGFQELPFALPILHARLGQAGDRRAAQWRGRAADPVQLRARLLHGRHGDSVGLRAVLAQPDAAQAARRVLQRAGPGQAGQDAVLPRLPLRTCATAPTSFRIAPGIKGMVMLVFDLPSFPFVFKVIKDFYPPQKDTSREQIRGKYLLVKQHDRVGRMADTLEFSEVAFPLDRFEPELVAELQKFAPSQLEISDRDGDGQTELILKHLYIERRMIPLNIYLQECFDVLRPGSGAVDGALRRAQEQLEHAVVEYGNAIKDLVAANIFPGDMLWKNFGITRHGKVVFYDYDEIEYVTDCNFRRVPAPRNEEDEMSGEIWYSVGPKDVFPETFGPFLLGNPRCARCSCSTMPICWTWPSGKATRNASARGMCHVYDVFPTSRTSASGARAHRRPAGGVDLKGRTSVLIADHDHPTPGRCLFSENLTERT